MSVRIRRLTVRDFGPFASLDLRPDVLTVVHGGNEAGKTSCIDAILHGLRGLVRPGPRRWLDAALRGPGEGAAIDLELEPADGGPLVALLREHPSLARLFVVRDGDAALEAGRGWLDAIRGRLSGIDLARVAERVRAEGGLTPGGALRAARVTERDRARERVAAIDAFVSDLPSIDALVEERTRCDRERDALRVRVDRLRAAARWQEHRLLERTRAQVREASDRAARLARHRPEDLAAWREAVAALREAAALAKNAEFNAAVLVEQASLDAARLRDCEAAVAGLEEFREEVRERGLPEQVEEARGRTARAPQKPAKPAAARKPAAPTRRKPAKRGVRR